jgi:Sulfotransferase family
MDDSPVFVVGMNGSGTTMLAESLGRHPELYMFPHESKVLPYFLANIDRFGDLDTLENRRRLADAIGATKPYWQVNGGAPFVLDNASLGDCSNFGEIVSQIYMAFANRQNKYRWGDKSPANTHHIASLAAGFPTAKFVHIIRDGRDAAQSFHRRWGYQPRHTIWRWKRAVAEGRRQGSSLPPHRYLEVRYEDVTASPDAEIKRICAFLGLAFDQSLLESSMRYFDASNESAHSGRIIENSGKWRTYFNPRQITELETISGELLYDLGYSVGIRGNVELNSFERRMLKLQDGFFYTTWFFRQYGLKSVYLYGRAVTAALKQWSVTRR